MQNLTKDDRDAHIEAVIKSNLVSFGLSTDQIDKITRNLTDDILDFLENFELGNRQARTLTFDENGNQIEGVLNVD